MVKCDLCHENDISYDNEKNQPRHITIESNGRRGLCIECVRKVVVAAIIHILNKL